MDFCGFWESGSFSRSDNVKAVGGEPKTDTEANLNIRDMLEHCPLVKSVMNSACRQLSKCVKSIKLGKCSTPLL